MSRSISLLEMLRASDGHPYVDQTLNIAKHVRSLSEFNRFPSQITTGPYGGLHLFGDLGEGTFGFWSSQGSQAELFSYRFFFETRLQDFSPTTVYKHAHLVKDLDQKLLQTSKSEPEKRRTWNVTGSFIGSRSDLANDEPFTLYGLNIGSPYILWAGLSQTKEQIKARIDLFQEFSKKYFAATTRSNSR
ncbi:hypothetical protein HOC01_06525 [archaeon]|jgi:hypothetical protein|nr:hypothetical protein [archaeon]MBT6697504.1 hypothetical protein [archaeon]